MGLFDFIKRKNKSGDSSKPVRQPIEANAHGQFGLLLSDFEEVVHRSTVLEDGWVNPNPDPEFEKALAAVTLGPPMRKGDVIELKWYAVRVVLWGHVIELTFEPDTVSIGLGDFVQNVNQQLDWLSRSKDLFDDVIKRDLLQLKNASWLDEDQPPMNAEEFLQSIRLTSINFTSHAAFSLDFDDGGLFEGHSFFVYVSSKGKVEKARIG